MPRGANKLQLDGKRFGLWQVIGYAGTRHNQTYWKCMCDCGTERNVAGTTLTRGTSVSCGCQYRDGKRKHGEGGKTNEYFSWAAVIERCCNPKNSNYHNYGGRGIEMCERWRNSYSAFLKDMGRRPSAKHSLDRLDNNKGYYKENCAWRTSKEQLNNTRVNRWIEIDGERHTLTQWSEKVGITANAVKARLLRGWSERDALFVPLIEKTAKKGNARGKRAIPKFTTIGRPKRNPRKAA